MEDHSSIPEPSIPASISYRQLADRLRQAPAEAEPDERLDALFADWARSSRHLLAVLQRGGSELSRGRSPRQVMALGALQAHLAMALQAHGASSRPTDDR